MLKRKLHEEEMSIEASAEQFELNHQVWEAAQSIAKDFPVDTYTARDFVACIVKHQAKNGGPPCVALAEQAVRDIIPIIMTRGYL